MPCMAAGFNAKQSCAGASANETAWKGGMFYVFFGDNSNNVAFTSTSLIFGPESASVKSALQDSGGSCNSMGEAAARVCPEGGAR